MAPRHLLPARAARRALMKPCWMRKGSMIVFYGVAGLGQPRRDGFDADRPAPKFPAIIVR